jgi:chromate reductase
MATHKVGYIVGSLARASINRKLAKALVRLAPDGMKMTEITFRDLPYYSYDYDADYPAPARAFKRAIEDSDAILFVTPEYNRSIPGALKNAIDWASRPHGKNAFNRKPTAVIGCSIGKIGTAVAQRELRGILSYCNSPQLMSPEAYIYFSRDMIDDEGVVKDAPTIEFLNKFMNAFRDFLGKVSVESKAA